jgi:hypothetical protein
MYWVVQRNFYSVVNHSILIETLDRLGIPFEEVDIIAGKIEGSDFIKSQYGNSGIITCGGSVLSEFALSQGWTPGSFINTNFHYSAWSNAYGSNLLNRDAVIDTLGNINPIWDSFFIRPSEDTKAFNGSLFTKEQFESWRYDFLGSVWSSRFENDQVIVASCKTIYAEYRFFVIDGEIISYSQYKSGQQVLANPDVSYDCVAFAQSMIDIWQPARAFVIDIALTPDGYAVVEINNINSSGFYACNVAKIVSALDNMQF